VTPSRIEPTPPGACTFTRVLTENLVYMWRSYHKCISSFFKITSYLFLPFMGGPSLGWTYNLRENLYSTCATNQEQKWRSWWVAHVVVYKFFSEILDSTWWWPPINSRNMHLTLSTICVNAVVLILRQTYTIFYQCQTHNRDDVTKDLQRYFQFLVFSVGKIWRLSEKRLI
jgi:hypothetical protein